jgi:nucleotide-binding universal stress UspA family protein
MPTPDTTHHTGPWTFETPDETPLRKILVATALLERSVTVAFAHRLAQPGITEVMLFHCIEMPRAELRPSAFAATSNWQTNVEARRAAAEQSLEAYAESFQKRGIQTLNSIHIGIAHEQILEEAAAWHPELLVIGNRATSVLSKFLIGSTAETVVRHADCPVLISHRAQS